MIEVYGKPIQKSVESDVIGAPAPVGFPSPTDLQGVIRLVAAGVSFRHALARLGVELRPHGHAKANLFSVRWRGEIVMSGVRRQTVRRWIERLAFSG